MPTSPTTITALPTAPDPNDRSTFNARAYPWSAALVTWTTQTNNAATVTYNNAVEAATSATNAAASASTAATQATNAANSASAASTSATNAAASATAAAASYDSFDDRYLGPKAADPSLDNDGNALLTGALYFNTSSNEMRVWSGTGWAAAYVPAGGYATLTGAETFTNKTLVAPVVLASTTATQDGVIVTGRAGGTSSYRVTIAPTTLTASRAVTLPDAAGVVVLDAATQTLTNKTLTTPVVTGPRGTLTALGNSGTSAQTLNASTASTYTLTATGNFTISFSGFNNGTTSYIQLLLTNGGSQTITWPTVSWIKPDGTTTTSISTYLSSLTGRTALQTSGVDQFVFWSNDGGTTVYGKIV